ncbi:AEC family transporter [Pleurocapsa sp. FMAR1]|uniref:AEC family transporter n=1 Tax=Pleurocapsa sp. FMAR1 TaxID=3040204 RepID=UPI0029C8FE96|nr:AEC family transporter [Pleurocapsa sp. FMAR1]
MVTVLQSILWVILGILIYRKKIVGDRVPKLLGKTLYWLGVPLQIFALARKSNFEKIVWLPITVTVTVLLLGLALTLLILHIHKKRYINSYHMSVMSNNPQNSIEARYFPSSNSAISLDFLPFTNAGRGSFIITSILGNTGFIGLALVPHFVDQSYWSWIVLYGIAHNVLGSYGLGVLVADRYSCLKEQSNWLNQLSSIVLLPSLWAFVFGYLSQGLTLTNLVETGISLGTTIVLPGAFILIGMQLGMSQQWQNLKTGVFSTLIKMLVLPGITGLALTFFGFEGDGRLVLVLMSGMPTAFASVILAEAYNLNRNVAASGILLSTLFLPIVLFGWLKVF